jgi:predicted phage tail protein
MHHALCACTTLNEQTSAARKLADEGWVTVYEGVDNSVRITGLQSGAVYRFRVAAVNARGGSSLWSELAQVNGRTTVMFNDLIVQVLALSQMPAVLMTCVAVALESNNHLQCVLTLFYCC